MNPGAGTKDGRCRASPRAFARSLFLTGFGEQTFTGPDSSGCLSRKRKASVRSCVCTHENHWRPLPMGPPTNFLKRGIILTQCPSTGAEYYPEPGYRHPCPFLLGFEGLSLPFRGNRREEVVSRW